MCASEHSWAQTPSSPLCNCLSLVKLSLSCALSVLIYQLGVVIVPVSSGYCGGLHERQFSTGVKNAPFEAKLPGFKSFGKVPASCGLSLLCCKMGLSQQVILSCFWGAGCLLCFLVGLCQ